jgi:arylsulfatase
MELADAPYPEKFMNRQILPFEGESLVASFNSSLAIERILFWEHQATRAVRMGDWKLVANRASNVEPYVGPWELYNLRNDRSETVDLSGDHPQIVRELDSLWNRWALRCHVYPLDGRGWFERLE